MPVSDMNVSLCHKSQLSANLHIKYAFCVVIACVAPALASCPQQGTVAGREGCCSPGDLAPLWPPSSLLRPPPPTSAGPLCSLNASLESVIKLHRSQRDTLLAEGPACGPFLRPWSWWLRGTTPSGINAMITRTKRGKAEYGMYCMTACRQALTAATFPSSPLSLCLLLDRHSG